jgi:hypothetical protein
LLCPASDAPEVPQKHCLAVDVSVGIFRRHASDGLYGSKLQLLA